MLKRTFDQTKAQTAWSKLASKIKTDKDLRLFTRKFFREKLRGLPPDFRLEINPLSLRPHRVRLHIPAHSEGNLIRVTQVDHLIEELEDLGIEVELYYLDDLEERVDF